MKIDMEAVARRMRGRMGVLNVSQRELSRRSGISEYTIQHWRHGNVARPQLQTAADIADALDLSLDYLVFGREHGENRRRWP